ncbi:MAG: hypothetical protein ACTSUM_04505 [Alphaproteobacteria bacterium]
MCFPTIKIISDFPFRGETISGLIIATWAGFIVWGLHVLYERFKVKKEEENILSNLLIDTYGLVGLFLSAKVDIFNEVEDEELFHKIIFPLHIKNLKKGFKLAEEHKKLSFLLNHVNKSLSILDLLLTDFNDISMRKDLVEILGASKKEEGEKIIKKRREQFNRIQDEVNTLLCGLFHHFAPAIKEYIKRNKLKAKLEYYPNNPNLIDDKDSLNWSKSFVNKKKKDKK